jgi:hypothetical protein
LRQRSGNESFAQGAMQEIDGTEFAEAATRKARLKILDRAFSLSRSQQPWPSLREPTFGIILC